jgi:hypothetical protein
MRSLHQERRFLFNSYVGAVSVQDGAQAVQKWITQLIRPDSSDCNDQILETDRERSRTSSLTPPPPKRIKNEPAHDRAFLEQIQTSVVPPRFSSALPQFSSSSTTLAPPALRALSSPPPQPTPPQLPSQPIGQPNPLTPARPNTQFLPMFNQVAMQRKVRVVYETSATGPAHALTWHALCIGKVVTL